LAKVISAVPTVTTNATTCEVKTIGSLRSLYRMVQKFEKQVGNEKPFLAKYGSEKQWLSQFKRQPYDVEA
jgi:hypothetical protein